MPKPVVFFAEATGLFGIVTLFLGSGNARFCSTFCLGTEDCIFGAGGLCEAGRIDFAPGAKDFFSIVLRGIFGGNPFDPVGRPGPDPLLLPSCLLESIVVEAGLLVETDLCNPNLECIWPFIGIGFLSSRPPLTLLPDGCLLFCGTCADRAS